MGYTKAGGRFAQKRTLPGLPPRKERERKRARDCESSLERDGAIVQCLGVVLVVAVVLVVLKATS